MKNQALYGVIKIALSAIRTKGEVTALTIQKEILEAKLAQLRFENDYLKNQITVMKQS